MLCEHEYHGLICVSSTDQKATQPKYKDEMILHISIQIRNTVADENCVGSKETGQRRDKSDRGVTSNEDLESFSKS